MEQKIGRKLYMGIVEDNNDPNRKGRVKARVQSLYNEIPTNDIPWASPFMDLAGKEYKVPAIGKIVNVSFLTNDMYDPYYIYSENYNINLENKLNDLSDDEYVNFVAMLFDERSQVFATNKEFTIDHLYNKITITKDTIDVNLKDNTQLLNLGDPGADQDAVLGNHWFNWFDKFVTTLLQPTSLLGNLSAPIVKPQIDQLLNEYLEIKNTFVSNNVKIVDNNEVSKNKRNPQNDTTKEDKDLIDNTFGGSDLSEALQEQANDACDVENSSKPSSKLPTPQTEFHDGTNPDTIETEEKVKINDKIYTVTDENRAELQALEREEDTKTNSNITQEKGSNKYKGQDYKINGETEDSAGTDTEKKFDRNKIEQIHVDIPESADMYPVYLNGIKIKDASGITYKGQIVISDYYPAIKKMIDAAERDGVSMSLNDAYRGYDHQYNLRIKFGGKKGKINESWLKTTNSRGKPPNNTSLQNDQEWFFWKTWEKNPYSNKMQVAPPGFGYHTSGRAFDISTRKNDVYEWLQENAIEFGFARVVKSEPWHWEYKPWEYRDGSGRGGNFEPWNMYSFVPEGHSSWTSGTSPKKKRKGRYKKPSNPREC